MKRLLRTEPVRIAAVVEAVLVVLAAFTGWLTPTQATAIVGLIIPTHELIRSVVYAPATVEGE